MTFGANSCKISTAHSLCPFWSLKSPNFHFQSSEFHHDGIHIPVYSLSLIADRSDRRPSASGDEGYGAVSGSCDVHFGGPGVPSLAVSGRHEGYWQGQVPEFPCDPDRPLQWHGWELGPVLGCIEVRSVTSCLGGPLFASSPPPAAAQPAWWCHGASRKQVSSSSRPPPRGAAKPRARGPRTGDRRWSELLFRRWWLHRSFPRRRAGW